MLPAIFVIGLVLISTGLKNTQHKLGEQLQRDLLGPNGFIAWAAAVIAIGCLGYIPGLRQSSRYLLLLLAVVMVVRNPGIFANVQTALVGASKLGPAPSVPSQSLPAPQAAAGATSSSGGKSKAGGIIGGLVTAVGVVAAPYTGGASLAAAGAINAGINAVDN